MKLILGILIGISVSVIVAFLFLQYTNRIANQDQIVITTPTATSFATPVSSSEPTPQATGAGTGTIAGKLCYPSHFLPAGSIEAKNTITNAVVSQVYLGSEGGGGNTYSIAVPAGTYILRYKAGETYGYHTDVCPTGLETTCAADNPRNNNQVIIASGQNVVGIDLCDFYYSETTNPGF